MLKKLIDYDIHLKIEYHDGHLDFYYEIVEGTFTTFDIELYKKDNTYKKQDGWSFLDQNKKINAISYDAQFEYCFLLSSKNESEIIELDRSNFKVDILGVPNTIEIRYGEKINTFILIAKKEFAPNTSYMNTSGIIAGSLFIAVPLCAVMSYKLIMKWVGGKHA